MLQVANLPVETGSADTISTDDSHRSMTVTTQASSKTFDANLFVATSSTSTKEIDVKGLTVGQGQSNKVAVTSDNNSVEITNNAQIQNVNLTIKQEGTNEGTFQPDKPVTIQSGDRVIVSPTDWNNLDNSGAIVQTDSGNDGGPLQTSYLEITSASLSADANEGDTFYGPVTVTLTDQSTPEFTIAHTYYKVDNGSQQTYSAPFIVTGNGSHTLTYWSDDTAGDTEIQNTKTFTIVAIPDATGSIHTLSPSRILDTRTTTGGHLGTLGTGETIDLKVLGEGGVPTSSVSAVIVNLTVVPGTSAGYLTLYPSGVSRPLVSNINYIAGTTVANQAVVNVGSDGKIKIYNNAGNNHVIVDVEGWVGQDYLPSTGKVKSFSPTRILDTRTTTGGHLGILGTGETMTLPVRAILNSQNISTTGVKAIIANITAVPTSNTASYLTVYPDDPKPLVSNVNFSGGVVIANLSLIPLKTSDGSIKIFNNVGAVHVIVDVQAVVLDGSSEGLQSVQPSRILDTRTTSQPIGPAGTIDLQVLGKGGIPTSGVSAVILHLTETGGTSSSYFTMYPSGTTRPLASTLNFNAGQTVSNNVIVPVGANGSVSIYNNAGSAHAIVDVQGWILSP